YHPRRPRPRGAPLPEGRRRPRLRGEGRGRSPRRGGPGPRRSHPPRLAGPHRLGALDAADACRAHVPYPRRAPRALLSHVTARLVARRPSTRTALLSHVTARLVARRPSTRKALLSHVTARLVARRPSTRKAMLALADIDGARRRIEGAVYETPCPYSRTLSELSGARCFVKLENLQMTGSFKERGAVNLLLQLEPATRARGVIAASAGNHGLAVAFHAARLGIPAVIVMPEWAPLIKVTSSRRYGAEVILHGANYDEAYGRACEVQAERGLAFVHPFDDERVIAGQGTLG